MNKWEHKIGKFTHQHLDEYCSSLDKIQTLFAFEIISLEVLESRSDIIANYRNYTIAKDKEYERQWANMTLRFVVVICKRLTESYSWT